MPDMDEEKEIISIRIFYKHPGHCFPKLQNIDVIGGDNSPSFSIKTNPMVFILSRIQQLSFFTTIIEQLRVMFNRELLTSII